MTRNAVNAARGEKMATVVARLIASDIVQRDLDPGSPLPTEQDMAQHLGVGRPSIREALRLLESQGIIVIRPGQNGGPMVIEPTGADLGRTMSLFLQMSRASFRDVMEAAVRVEGTIAAMAAERVAAGDTTNLPKLVQASEGLRVEGATDIEFASSGSGLHAVMYEMAGNTTLGLMASGLRFLYNRRTHDSHGGHWGAEEREEIRDQHRQIVRAIKLGRPEKARVLNEAHLRGQMEYIDKVDPALLDSVMVWV